MNAGRRELPLLRHLISLLLPLFLWPVPAAPAGQPATTPGRTKAWAEKALR